MCIKSEAERLNALDLTNLCQTDRNILSLLELLSEPKSVIIVYFFIFFSK